MIRITRIMAKLFPLWLVILFYFSRLARSSPLAPALYVFGDSLFDSGNNNLLPTLAKADYLPYGVNFDQGVTGRFTNGKTVADFIADYLGLPNPPPYLSIRGSAAVTGLNYASGSCGILPETGSQYGKCLNMKDQIDLFEITTTYNTSELRRYFKNPQDFSHYLSKSIFIFSVGNNDYINNYLERQFSIRKNYSPRSFAQLLVDELAQHFQRLYKLGARKVIMFELGPLGCLPSITRKRNHGTKCVEEINQLASYFNERLPPMLNNLTSTLQGSTFVLGHANWLAYDAIQNPTKYALMDARNPCCTTWLNGTSGCIPFLTPCDGTNNHFFWDAYHLTESACSVIASGCFNDSSVCSPFIKQLVEI
ncbi:GDSL esterase/lipase 7 [Morus notabilis]|uniref:GDSL esterase/lipase 7 n=1 Tax=Morus notabilis TaxID=981085 RepID=UPI000CED422C|nr:GDSL esterase/lipase 7 [Morus notabilis]